jgi:hypothetical protein
MAQMTGAPRKRSSSHDWPDHPVLPPDPCIPPGMIPRWIRPCPMRTSPNKTRAIRITVCFIVVLLLLAEWEIHSEHHFAEGASLCSRVKYRLLTSYFHHDRSLDSHRTLTTWAEIEAAVDERKSSPTIWRISRSAKRRCNTRPFRQPGGPSALGMWKAPTRRSSKRVAYGAGMHWERHNVNPMFVLRNAVCNGRWDKTWQASTMH